MDSTLVHFAQAVVLRLGYLAAIGLTLTLLLLGLYGLAQLASHPPTGWAALLALLVASLAADALVAAFSHARVDVLRYGRRWRTRAAGALALGTALVSLAAAATVLVGATLELAFEGTLSELSVRHVALAGLAALAAMAASCALSHLWHLGRCIATPRAPRLDIDRLNVV